MVLPHTQFRVQCKVINMLEQIQGLLLFLLTLSGATALVWHYWEEITKIVTKSGLEKTKFDELPDNSPLKKILNKQDRKLDEIFDKMDEIYWDTKDTHARVIAVEMGIAITHKRTPKEIMSLFDEYRSVPNKTNKPRNGVMEFIAKDYIKKYEEMEDED